MFEKKGFGSDRRRTAGAAPSGIEHHRGGRLAPVCNVELFFSFLKCVGVVKKIPKQYIIQTSNFFHCQSLILL